MAPDFLWNAFDFDGWLESMVRGTGLLQGGVADYLLSLMIAFAFPVIRYLLDRSVYDVRTVIPDERLIKVMSLGSPSSLGDLNETLMLRFRLSKETSNGPHLTDNIASAFCRLSEDVRSA